jgi:hypothetical protein
MDPVAQAILQLRQQVLALQKELARHKNGDLTSSQNGTSNNLYIYSHRLFS